MVKSVLIHLEGEVHSRLKGKCKDEGVSVKRRIEQLIEEYLRGVPREETLAMPPKKPVAERVVRYSWAGKEYEIEEEEFRRLQDTIPGIELVGYVE